MPGAPWTVIFATICSCPIPHSMPHWPPALRPDCLKSTSLPTAEYFQWGLKLAHPGSLIIADNVVRQGAVVDATSSDPNVQGVRRFYDLVATERRVTATAIQTVGSKGHDGLAVALVTG